MKTIRTTYILIFLVFITKLLFAQGKEIGFNIGYGKTTFGHNGKTLISPFDSELPNYFRFGFCYSYTPNKTIFSIESGLNYDHKGQNDKNFNYLRLPIDIEFSFGKKIQLVVGTGIYVSYLISYNIPHNGDPFEDSKNRLQIGLQGNIGIGFKLSHRYNLNIMFQQNMDITRMYDSHGFKYNLEEIGHDGFVNFNLKYKLFDK